VGPRMICDPWHVSILIPARNEEKLLPRCLQSVFKSLSILPPSVTTDVIVAVDRSTDLTYQIAKDMTQGRGVAIAIESGVVGKARAVAAEIAMRRYRGPWNRLWLAKTDADCVVPDSWVLEQLLLAGKSAEAIAGTVQVDSFEEHSPEVSERFRAHYIIASDGSHSHIHGANLGIRGDVYRKSGGWRELETAEDHDLWHRLQNLGARTVSVDHTRVITSGRRAGRAPHGFAEALAAHNEVAA
jgi:glycosyltransferase involved in cell wall biosynthesis